jgi:hypothetical protein
LAQRDAAGPPDADDVFVVTAAKNDARLDERGFAEEIAKHHDDVVDFGRRGVLADQDQIGVRQRKELTVMGAD